MKILLACVHFHSSFGWSIARALSRAKHEVRIFDYRQPPTFAFPGYARFWSRNIMPGSLLSFARSLKPDLLFLAKGESIPPWVLKTIRQETNCRVINWFPDARLFAYANVLGQIPYLDHLFSKNKIDLDRLKLLGFSKGSFLHHCGDRELHLEYQPSESDLDPYRCQVAFVGSYYPYREAILSQILDFDLRIWGGGWRQSSILRRKPHAVVGKEARSFEQTCVFRGAVVNLNTHHYDDVASLNQRVFDIAGAGGCQLVDDGRDLQVIFQVPEEIETFDSVSELREKIQMLVDRPTLSREMGRRAAQKTAAKHTYDDRVAQIFDLLKTS